MTTLALRKRPKGTHAADWKLHALHHRYVALVRRNRSPSLILPGQYVKEGTVPQMPGTPVPDRKSQTPGVLDSLAGAISLVQA